MLQRLRNKSPEWIYYKLGGSSLLNDRTEMEALFKRKYGLVSSLPSSHLLFPAALIKDFILTDCSCEGFSCCKSWVAAGGGGGTDGQTDRQTETHIRNLSRLVSCWPLALYDCGRVAPPRISHREEEKKKKSFRAPGSTEESMLLKKKKERKNTFLLVLTCISKALMRCSRK